MVIAENILRLWSVALIIGGLIPFMREQTWWLRAWTYARLQMLFLCGCTAIIVWTVLGREVVSNQIIFGGLVMTALGCLWDLLPFTKVWRRQTRDLVNHEPHVSIRLMVGNVLMENTQFEEYLSQIRAVAPDLILLIETDEIWREKLKGLETEYPHNYALPLPDFNGLMFYSRFPMLESRERYLVQDHIPSLTFKLDMGLRSPVHFYGLHPRPPRPRDDPADMDKELHFIANEVGHIGEPVIVTGDLNDVGWSSTTKKFLRLSGLFDPRHGRGLFNSYNAKNPLVRWPLDHVFHSRHFSLIDMKRLKAFGSDHFPLLITLALHKND